MATTLVAVGRPLTTWRQSRPAAIALAAVAVLAVIVQVVVGEPRWQLIPVYLAAALAAGAGLSAASRRDSRLSGIGAALVGLALVLTGAALSWALPVPSLPVPQGPHAVGTTTVVITDPDRAERFGSQRGEDRRLVAQLYYPAVAPDDDEADAAQGTPLMTGGGDFARTVAAELGLPRFALGHLDLVATNALEGAAPASNGRVGPDEQALLPVVVLSHGWTGFRTAQLDLVESLASHGNVVVAIDHTYGSMATVFPDGEVVPHDPAALPDDVPADVRDAASERLVAMFADDIAVTLDHLEQVGVEPLIGRLDLERIAVLGHSTGGGAAVLHCARDPRCHTVVGFDPWVVPVPDAVIGEGLEVPLLSLVSEEWADNDNATRLRRLHAASSAGQGRVTIAGTRHEDVTVLRYLSPLAPRVGLTGQLPPERVHEIVETWTRRFLVHHRDDDGPDPLRAPPQLDEAVLEPTGD